MSLLNWCEQKLESVHFGQGDLGNGLSDLTVIILSYERQDFLFRQIAYWKAVQIQILILDGSKKSLPIAFLKKLSKFSHIKYKHMPVSIQERFTFAGSEISTKYAILLGDDEFLLKRGLLAAVNKLEERPELCGCIGQSIKYFINEDLQCSYDLGYDHWKYQVTDDEFGNRLMKAMETYNAATCYAVLRREVWAQSWGNMEQWSSPYASEMKQALSTYICGKFIAIDEVYWMRSDENSPVSIEGFNRDNSFNVWWISEKNKTEHESFLNNLSKLAFKMHPTYSLEEIRNKILKSINFFVETESIKSNITVTNLSMLLSFKLIFLKTLKDLIGEKPYLLIKNFYQSIKVRKSLLGSLGSLKDIKNTKINNTVTVDEHLAKELEEMQDLILDFYQARLKGN